MQGDRETSLYIRNQKWYKLYYHKDQLSEHTTQTDERYTQGRMKGEKETRERESFSKCQIIIPWKLNRIMSSMADFGYGIGKNVLR